METLINQIDHILLQTKYQKEIYKLLTEELGLPKVWPSKSFGGIFRSGGVGFGNINIEILNYAKFTKLLRLAPTRDGIIGIAFEPAKSIATITEELDKSNIPYSKPRTFYKTVGGKNEPNWTNLFLKNILPKSQIFFCKYYFDIYERRNRMEEELRKRNGGLLGVEYVKELHIGCDDLQLKDIMTKLSGTKIEKNNNTVAFHNGPTVIFEKSGKNRILEVLIKVTSIENAKERLNKNTQIQIDSENRIIFRGKEHVDLGLRLCE